MLKSEKEHPGRFTFIFLSVPWAPCLVQGTESAGEMENFVRCLRTFLPLERKLPEGEVLWAWLTAVWGVAHGGVGRGSLLCRRPREGERPALCKCLVNEAESLVL